MLNLLFNIAEQNSKIIANAVKITVKAVISNFTLFYYTYTSCKSITFYGKIIIYTIIAVICVHLYERE